MDCYLCGVGFRPGAYNAILRKHPWLQHEDEESSSFYSQGGPQEEEEESQKSKAPANEELPLTELQWRKVQADADKSISEAKTVAEKAAQDIMAIALKKTQTSSPSNTQTSFASESLVDFLVSQRDYTGKPRRSVTPVADGQAANPQAASAGAAAKGSAAGNGADEESDGGDDDFEAEDGGGGGSARPSAPQGETRTRTSGSTKSGSNGLGSLEDVSLPPPSSSSGTVGGAAVADEVDDETKAAHHSTTETAGEGTVASDTPDGAKPRSPQGGNYEQVPLYFKGGESNEGFGNLLGNALSVLYVARHGLTATELTRLLIKLRESSDKKLCSAIWKQREILIDMFREMDDNDTGFLEQKDVFTVILRLDPKLRPAKLDRLCKLSQARLEEGQAVEYQTLIDYCGSVFHTEQPFGYKVTGEGEDRMDTLSTEPGSKLEHGVEEALLKVLTALGVMFSRKDQVQWGP